MMAVRRIERHRHRTESRSSKNVSGAKIRNPIRASLRPTDEAHLGRVERPCAAPGLERHGSAFGEVVEPAVAHGIAPERVRLAVVAAHRPGATVAVQLEDGACHLNARTDPTTRTRPLTDLPPTLRPGSP
jgi:hypothetical protein